MKKVSSVIKFSNVTKEFTRSKSKFNAIDNISFEVAEGEIFSIIGKSGAGKSTLIRLINQLEQQTSGKIEVLGSKIEGISQTDLKNLRKDVGMIFQQFNLFNSKTVYQNVEFPLKLAKVPKSERESRVKELLEFVGLEKYAKSHPTRLSGGQKQRVGIARALATNPKILLADEPTSALDPQTTVDVLRLLKQVNKEFGITIVMITHAMDVAKFISDSIAVMEKGKIVETGKTIDVFEFPKSEITQNFIAVADIGNYSDSALKSLRKNHPELNLEIDELLANAKQKVFSNEFEKALKEGAESE